MARVALSTRRVEAVVLVVIALFAVCVVAAPFAATPPPPSAASAAEEAATACHNATGACRAQGFYRCLTTRSQRLALGDPEEESPDRNATSAIAHLVGHAAAHGFLDADPDAEHVPWSARCDGVADCPDGSDELMCNVLPWAPSHPGYHRGGGGGGGGGGIGDDDDEHADQEVVFDEAKGTMHRHGGASSSKRGPALDRGRVMHPMFSESTCIGCTCYFGTLRLTLGASAATTHPWFEFGLAARSELALNDACPAGRGCNPINTRVLAVRLYKKHRLCRMAVCCVRQDNCIGCRGTVSGATAAKKCWGDSC